MFSLIKFVSRKDSGPFQYVLVTIMTCSTLAAIMSTADSAVMGVSSIVSIDLFKGTMMPKLSNKQVVRLGELTSVAWREGMVGMVWVAS